MSAAAPRALATYVAALTGAGIIAQQVAAKAVRDALFLSVFHVHSLPLAMGAAAVLSLLVVSVTSRLMTAYSPRRVLLAFCAVSAFVFCAEWAALRTAPRFATVLVYLHVGVGSPVILSAFWSLVSERFDPHAARTAMSRITTGASIGGVIGGFGAWRASSVVALPAMLLLLATANMACALGVVAMRRPPTAKREPIVKEPYSATVSGVVRKPYLLSLALMVAAGAAISSMLDYVLSAQVTAARASGAPLLAFFSLFGLAVSVVSLVLQLTFGRVALERLGIAIHMAVLPGIVILGGAFGMAVPGLASATLLRGAEMVQRNTVFRAAYELLYTPLPEHERRATKALIDVGFDRVGTICGSVLAVAAAFVFRDVQSALLVAVVLLAIGTLPLSRALHRGYVATLKERLREEADSIEPAPLLAATDFEQRELLAKLGRDDEKDDGTLVRETLAHRGDLVLCATALLSSNTQKRKGALAKWSTWHAPLASFAIMALASDDVHLDARKALRAVCNQVTGQLADALLAPSTDFVIRRRIPAVLSSCKNQRAVDALLAGLADARFEVRYACVRALLTITGRNPTLDVSRDVVFDAVRRALERLSATFQELDDGSDEEPNPLLDLVTRDRVTRGMELVFSLLSLVLDRDGLRLCFIGLHHDDARRRGMALEYLQSVLPADLWDELSPLLEAETVRRAQRELRLTPAKAQAV